MKSALKKPVIETKQEKKLSAAKLQLATLIETNRKAQKGFNDFKRQIKNDKRELRNDEEILMGGKLTWEREEYRRKKEKEKKEKKD